MDVVMETKANSFLEMERLGKLMAKYNGETYHHAKEYFFWVTVGIPFYMFGQALNPIIRSDGSPKFAMASTLAGALVNIILDPVFIFVFRWGMMVLATVNKGTFIYLQSLGKAFASTAISMVREVLFGVGFALLLPVWFGLDGVLYSMPVSDLLTFVICVMVIRYTCKALETEN